MLQINGCYLYIAYRGDCRGVTLQSIKCVLTYGRDVYEYDTRDRDSLRMHQNRLAL